MKTSQLGRFAITTRAMICTIQCGRTLLHYVSYFMDQVPKNNIVKIYYCINYIEHAESYKGTFHYKAIENIKT